MKKLLKKLPVGLATFVTVCLVLYITLFPDPMHISGVKLFEGADKIIHFLMFLAIAVAIMFDYIKFRFPHHAKFERLLIICILTIFFGLLTEVLQNAMQLGRTGSTGDLFADALGAIAGLGITYSILDKYYRKAFKTHRRRYMGRN